MALTKNQKYTFLGLGVAVLGGMAFYISRIAKRLQDFTLDFKKIKVKRFTKERLQFDVYFDYTNKSEININLASQEYDVYIDGVYITTMTNYKENVLKAKSKSSLGFSVDLDLPKLDSKIRASYFDMITNPKEIAIRIDMKFKARIGIFKVPYRYVWNTNLKEILGWYLPMYK
jgi:LEA14-like dessication related protein